jgi:hypothetical protein
MKLACAWLGVVGALGGCGHTDAEMFAKQTELQKIRDDVVAAQKANADLEGEIQSAKTRRNGGQP